MKEFKFFKGQESNIFDSFSFPIIRGTMPRLIGDELVPVQPMMEPPQRRTITRHIPGLNVGEINWINTPMFSLLYFEDGNINVQQENRTPTAYRTTLNSFLEQNINDYIFVYQMKDINSNIYTRDNISELSGEEIIFMRAVIFKREIVV